MNFLVEPLSNVLGAAISGLDLKIPLNHSEINKLFELFYQYQVLVFRNQELTQEQQIKACGQFGEIELHPMKYNTCSHPEMTIVSNVIENGKPVGFHGPEFELWHSDMCYYKKIAKMTFLYAHIVPDDHNDTLFANMYSAYDELPESIKSIVTGKEAVFGAGLNLMNRCQQRGYDLRISAEDIKPDVIHPVVSTHPYTKKKSLFVNWTHTDYILGLSSEESDDILNKIYEHQSQRKFVYSHHYLPGDLIVWDNFSTLHTGTPKRINKPRVMHRVVIKSNLAPSYA